MIRSPTFGRPRPVRRSYRRINRGPSPVLAVGLPWLSILFASLLVFSPIIASAPVLPPLAAMLLLAWRMLRPTLMPIWAGLPLGAFDDLFSGQPFGSAIVLFSAMLLAMDMIDERFLWRGFVQDWLAAMALLAVYVVLAAGFAGLATGYPMPLAIGPQLLVTLILFPVVTRLVAAIDHLRLTSLHWPQIRFR